MKKISFEKNLSKFDELEIVDLTKEYHAIIFDMDGTITSTEDLHYEATCTIAGKNLSSDDLYGLSDRDLYDHFIKSPHLSYEDFIKKKNEYIKSSLLKQSLKNIMKYDFHSLFTKLHKKKLALVTASEDEVARSVLSFCKIDHFFDYIITTKDVNNSKPHPEPYLLALSKLGITSDKAIVFEDSDTGISAANQADIKVIKVSWYLEEN